MAVCLETLAGTESFNQKVCWLGQYTEFRLEQAGFRVSALILRPQTLLPLMTTYPDYQCIGRHEHCLRFPVPALTMYEQEFEYGRHLLW